VKEPLAHATQRELVFAYRWTVDDLLLWDGSCTTHKARTL
jgi:alpha-ketoglutarate-dependent taurine dioxygenase